MIEGAGAASFHLFEVAARFDVAHEEEAFEGFDIGAGGNHVDGDCDAGVVFVAKLGKDGLWVFLVFIGHLFAEGIALPELLAHDLDDVVGMGVGLGEDEGLGDFVFALLVGAVGEDDGELVAEGADDGENLRGVDDVLVELLGGVGFVFVLLLPALTAGELFALLDVALEDGAAVFGDLGLDGEDFPRDIDAIGDRLFVGVFGDHVLFEEAEGAGIGGGGETDEKGVEVVEDLPPEIVDGAVALIDDDKVEVLDGHLFVIGDGERFLESGGGLVGVLLLVFLAEILSLQDGIHALDG